jgi:hypothetical protein
MLIELSFCCVFLANYHHLEDIKKWGRGVYTCALIMLKNAESHKRLLRFQQIDV